MTSFALANTYSNGISNSRSGHQNVVLASDSDPQTYLSNQYYTRENMLALFDHLSYAKEPAGLVSHPVATTSEAQVPLIVTPMSDSERNALNSSIHPSHSRKSTTAISPKPAAAWTNGVKNEGDTISSVLGSLHLDEPASAPALPPGIPVGIDVDTWQYKDPSGTIQGPFTSQTMNAWYSSAYFDQSLLVRRVGEATFETLSALCARNGTVNPFSNAPLQDVPRGPAYSGSPAAFASSPGVYAGSPAAAFANPSATFASSPAGSFVASPGGPYSGSPGAPFAASPGAGSGGFGSATSETFGTSAVGTFDPGFNPGFHSQTNGLWDEPVNVPAAQPNVMGWRAADPAAALQQQQQALALIRQQREQEQRVIQNLEAAEWSAWNEPVERPKPRVSADVVETLEQQVGTGSEGASHAAADVSAAAAEPATAVVPAVVPAAVAEPAVVPAPSPAKPKSKRAKAAEKPAEKVAEKPVEKAAEKPVEHTTEKAAKPSAKSADKASAPSFDDLGDLSKWGDINAPPAPADAAWGEWDVEVPKPAPAKKAVSIAKVTAWSVPSTKTADPNKYVYKKQTDSAWGAASGAEEMPRAVAASPPPAPWIKPQASPAPASAPKSLKEIQEEETRKKAAPPVVPAAYAKSVAANSGPAWNTIPQKAPAVRASAPVTKSLIPGLPVGLTNAKGALHAKSVPGAAPVRAAPAATPEVSRPAPAAPAVSVAAKAAAAVRSVPVKQTPVVYTADNPPPPSAEFMHWCKEALKGLSIPLEEFMGMALSFGLDPTPDVYEIISDSVYANSSTLDGRRFANDFISRRKIDALARYPHLTKTSAPTMASSLRQQPQNSTPDWSVKVQSKKKAKK